MSRVLSIIVFFYIGIVQLHVSGESLNLKLKRIKEQYKSINAYQKYTVFTPDDAASFIGYTDNGASLTGYLRNDTIFKIVVWIGLSNKAIQQEFYYTDEKLLFVFEKISFYEYDKKNNNLDYTKLNLKFSNRYYFDKGKLIYKLCEEEGVVAKTGELLPNAIKYYSLLQDLLQE